MVKYMMIQRIEYKLYNDILKTRTFENKTPMPYHFCLLL